MRWVVWVLKLSITVVIVSMLTVATTGYVVNWYVQSLLSSYNIPLEIQSLSVGSMMKGMLGFGGKGTGSKSANSKTPNNKSVSSEEVDNNSSDKGNESAKANANVHESADANDNMNSGAQNNGTGNSKRDLHENNNDNGSTNNDMNTGEGIPEDAFPVMGGISGQSQQSEQSQQSQQSQQQGAAGSQDQVVVITPDDLLAKKDELPDQQKEEVFNLLMSKLPEDDMRKMTEAMEDGLTEFEMIEIQQILSKHLDKEQYAKVMEMLK